MLDTGALKMHIFPQKRSGRFSLSTLDKAFMLNYKYSHWFSSPHIYNRNYYIQLKRHLKDCITLAR